MDCPKLESDSHVSPGPVFWTSMAGDDAGPPSPWESLQRRAVQLLAHLTSPMNKVMEELAEAGPCDLIMFYAELRANVPGASGRLPPREFFVFRMLQHEAHSWLDAIPRHMEVEDIWREWQEKFGQRCEVVLPPRAPNYAEAAHGRRQDAPSTESTKSRMLLLGRSLCAGYDTDENIIKQMLSGMFGCRQA
jgi:hypothetical protein